MDFLRWVPLLLYVERKQKQAITVTRFACGPSDPASIHTRGRLKFAGVNIKVSSKKSE